MIASSLDNLAGTLIPDAGVPPADPVADDARALRILRAAQGGCPEAFRSLMVRHQDTVYQFCFQYLRDTQDAEEACQDTFVRAHRALGRFTGRARLSTWLYTIALNQCRDRVRARFAQRRRGTVALGRHGDTMSCGRPAPDEVLMRGAEMAKLDRGLDALPAKFRDVIVLACLDGLSHAECGAVLGCSERAVEGRLYRARQALAAWWERDGG